MQPNAKYILPPLLLLAALMAWLVMSGVDTGPEVNEAPTPTIASIAPPRAPAAPMTTPAPASPTPVQATTTAQAPRSFDKTPTFPRPDGTMTSAGATTELGPEAMQRVIEASMQTMARRNDMMEQRFGFAVRAVPEGPGRDAAQEVLDAAINDMRGLEDAMLQDGLTYHQAQQEADRIRDDAGSALDDVLDPADADSVKLRIGIRPPPDNDQIFNWEGVPLEEAFKDWQ